MVSWDSPIECRHCGGCHSQPMKMNSWVCPACKQMIFSEIKWYNKDGWHCGDRHLHRMKIVGRRAFRKGGGTKNAVALQCIILTFDGWHCGDCHAAQMGEKYLALYEKGGLLVGECHELHAQCNETFVSESERAALADPSRCRSAGLRETKGWSLTALCTFNNRVVFGARKICSLSSCNVVTKRYCK